MLNKLGSNQLMVMALICAPLLMLQGLWLAFVSTPLTLLLILATSLLGFGLLIWLVMRLQQADRERQEQVWCRALQLRDPTCLETPTAQAALQQLLAHFNEAELDAHRQISELHNQATQDELTQLQNRHAFRRDMTELLQRDQDTQTATLVLVRATELGKLNAQRGFQSGDAYIKDIANLINKVVSRFPGHQVYRISGADFAVLVRPEANIPPPCSGGI